MSEQGERIAALEQIAKGHSESILRLQDSIPALTKSIADLTTTLASSVTGIKAFAAGLAFAFSFIGSLCGIAIEYGLRVFIGKHQ